MGIAAQESISLRGVTMHNSQFLILLGLLWLNLAEGEYTNKRFSWWLTEIVGIACLLAGAVYCFLGK